MKGDLLAFICIGLIALVVALRIQRPRDRRIMAARRDVWTGGFRDQDTLDRAHGRRS